MSEIVIGMKKLRVALRKIPTCRSINERFVIEQAAIAFASGNGVKVENEENHDLPENKFQKARNLAKQLYELCQDDEVCASIANMIWDENDSETPLESAEELLHNVGCDTPVEMMTALKLPDITGMLKQTDSEVDDGNDVYVWGDKANE